MTDSELKKKYLSLVNDVRFDELELLLEDVTFFEIIGASKAEIRHSNFLAWVLDPNASHGLGEAILKRFLRLLTSDDRVGSISEIEVESFNYSSVNILREWRNIDLLIEFDEVVICIENKLYSKEHSNQLKRYFNLIDKEFPNKRHVFGFLTPEGIEAERDNEVYVSISYAQVAEIIETVFKIRGDSLGQNIKVYISDYLKTLKRQVMETDTSIELAKDIYRNHKEILDFIFENKPDEKAPMVELIKVELLKRNWILDVSTNKNYLRFTTAKLRSLLPNYEYQKGGWPKKEPFLFELSFWSADKISFTACVSPGGIAEYLKELILSLDGAKQPKGKLWFTFFNEKMKFNFTDFHSLDEEVIKASVNKYLDKINAHVTNIENILVANEQQIRQALLKVENH